MITTKAIFNIYKGDIVIKLSNLKDFGEDEKVIGRYVGEFNSNQMYALSDNSRGLDFLVYSNGEFFYLDADSKTGLTNINKEIIRPVYDVKANKLTLPPECISFAENVTILDSLRYDYQLDKIGKNNQAYPQKFKFITFNENVIVVELETNHQIISFVGSLEAKIGNDSFVLTHL